MDIGEIRESRRFGKFQIMEKIKDSKATKYKIKFLNTGYEKVVYSTNIASGGVGDDSVPREDALSFKVGDKLINRQCNEALILEVKIVKRPNGNRTMLKIKFIASGYECESTPDNFTRGKTKDYGSPTVMNYGILGDIDKLDIIGRLRDCKEYRIWEGIIHRVTEDRPNINLSYRDVDISERWKRFDYFYEDIKKIEGYDKWKQFYKDNPKKKNEYEFDKDTKIIGNKTYCLEACRFIHKKHNAGFTSWASDEVKKQILLDIEKEVV